MYSVITLEQILRFNLHTSSLGTKVFEINEGSMGIVFVEILVCHLFSFLFKLRQNLYLDIVSISFLRKLFALHNSLLHYLVY